MIERRIGAYGGTFDPIHNGHVEIARAVAENFGLDQLLIIPAHRPPHKREVSISDVYNRYAMAVLATLDEPRIRVSTIELEAPDRPYTFETIERLKEAYKEQTRVYFIMGADSFEEINTWREPARLLSSANLIVAARPGHFIDSSRLPAGAASTIIDLRGQQAEARQGPAGEQEECCYTYLTDYVNVDFSSTEIRRRVKQGRKIDGLVPPGVVRYIEKYELYRR